MLTDDVTIRVKAGDGGDGVVRFSKIMMANGPTGGDGGRGGSVFIKGVSDLGALRPFRVKKSVAAADGGRGDQNNYTGANGDDHIINVPVGTWAHDLTNDVVYDVTQVGETFQIARGGNGGYGNFRFRSSKVHKFLRHIERTRVLFHFIAADSEDPLTDYETIRTELTSFSPELIKKPEWIIISRSDEKTDEEVSEICAMLKEKNKNTIALSLLDDRGIDELKKTLSDIAQKRTVSKQEVEGV